MKDGRLNETTIAHAKVIVDILPKGKVIPNTKITPTSITIHNTGVVNAPARNNHNYMKTCNKNGDRIASWHFTVDDKEIWQAQSSNYKCWHAGTAAGNNSSIGIEVCMFSDATRQRKAYDNAIALVKILMKHHGFGIDAVKRHKDWSGKFCPAYLLEGKYGYTWTWFKNQVAGKATPTTTTKPSTTTTTSNSNFTVKILTELNVRKGPGTNYGIVMTVKKGGVYTIVQTKGNWGKLKSGAGWISISPKYVQRR